MKILVTGATGFVGKALVTSLTTQNHQITALVRHHTRVLPAEVKQFVLSDISHLNNASESDPQLTALRKNLENIDVIIHAAARVHVMNDSENSPLTAFRLVNSKATLSLAEMAFAAGVKRFIFLSTIGVNGAQTMNRPFTEGDKASPHNDYSRSKWEAEQGLWHIQQETGLEVVIIRPPLVYGPGAKGNFATLMKWVKRGVPLPLKSVPNQRSLIALDNLVSFIAACVEHPEAAGEVFVIADGEDISTTELLRRVAHASGRNARLISIPTAFLLLLARLAGKQSVAESLLGSLKVDASKAGSLLGWRPPVKMDEQLRKCFEER